VSEDPWAFARVQRGDHVAIRYTARFADGSVFASSRDVPALAFVAGGAEVIAGLSDAVVGMSPGETKLVAIAPEQGFGARDDELERRIPRDELPESARVGDELSARAGDRVIPVWVREIGERHAVIDGNHPLAGHNLIFEIELVSFHS
jgi:peptidylprolyl isomerase